MASKTSTWWIAGGLFIVSIAAIGFSCAGEPNARLCSTGIYCPDGTECAAVQHVCIINKCGADCQSVLGGGGGGGTGGRDAGRMQRPLACEAFTQWPEICAQTGDMNGAGE